MRVPVVSSFPFLLSAGIAMTQAVISGASAQTVTDDSAVPEVVVTGQQEQPEGSAESGYRATTGTLGALGKVPLKDTPYSVSVVSSDMIENLQASSTAEALKYNPTVRSQLGSNLSSNYFMIRGFTSSPGGAAGSAAVDGMRASVIVEPVEDKERIEVINGASSFLYGFTSPAGIVNYNLKRPTDTVLNRVTAGDYGGEQGYVHGDFGGHFDAAHRFGYRVNLMKVDNGEVGVQDETHERSLASGVFDWRIAPNTVWSVDISHFEHDIDHQQGIFLLGNATSVPSAPNMTKNYAAPYNFTHDENNKIGTALQSKLDDTFSIRSAFRYTETENSSMNMRLNLLDNNGNYSYREQVKGTNQMNTTQGYAFLDAGFETGSIRHDATFGLSHDHILGRTVYPNGSINAAVATTLTGNILNPVYPADPGYSINLTGQLRDTEKTELQSTLLADRITLTDQWSLMVGGNLARIEDTTWNANSGVMTAQYAKEKLTPGGAIMFKPVPPVTTYVSYIESLQAGGVVPTDGANAGQALAPYVSKQVETGLKATVGGMDLNLALFRIEKANSYKDPATSIYSTGGKEVHTGAEFSFTGKVTDDVTLGGGFTALKAEITKSSTAEQEGKTPRGVPSYIATLFGEYAVPQLPGLSVQAGASYTGKEWVNAANTISIPEVFLLDAGARFKTELYGTPTTFRLNVSNLLDRRYWTNKGDDMLYVGNPRTIAFSMSMDF